jgi:hypothetical protein
MGFWVINDAQKYDRLSKKTILTNEVGYKIIKRLVKPFLFILILWSFLSSFYHSLALVHTPQYFYKSHPQ